MNTTIKNTIFSIVTVTLILNTIPKILQINFIAGGLQDKLVFYPIFIGLIYTWYC